jgi:hypothetical protein
VEEGVRGVTGLLLELAYLVAGGLLGYFLGLKQGRVQAQYDRRAEAVTELRRRLRETRRAFADLATPSENRDLIDEDRPREELAEEAGEKLDELAGHHEDHALWLDRRTYEKLDALTDQFAFALAEVQQRLEEEDDDDEAIGPLWDSLGREVADAADELDELFAGSLGQRPWWRRMFGG